ncbi:hypothetical protein N9P66_03875 [Salibacteraceae bacterium]|nr:hypothetical protein [Salibacteraceae bacterium]MDA9267491.1 hypothetical protein [Salibacteraceae bacterium]MDB4105761.1 hypothetical protein [Salibacteraceae bacterium]MDB9710242.1 hypothetical protein [Salibacteraceae bacterium]HAQ70853.1 hypothetical protein [Flavobacteriales bacterium]
MSFANEVINKLFGSSSNKANTSNEKLVLDSGQIKRSEKELKEYQKWSDQYSSDLLFELKQNALFSKKNLTNHLNFVWLNRSTANGFQLDLLNLKTPLGNTWYLAEIIKQKIIDLGYMVTHAEYADYSENDKLCRKEWLYLKTPHRMRIGTPPFNQLYGNIQLESIQKDTMKFKLLATTYSDRNYNSPLPFDDLVDAIFY